mgnify:CR=1 FL=1
MNEVQKILSREFAKTIKEYKEIQKLIDPLVKRFFESYYEDWWHFKNWDFDDAGDVIINYSYLDYNDDWEYDSISVSLYKIIEMI